MNERMPQPINPESEEFATAQEVQDFHMWIHHVYIPQINAMGGNDSETSIAYRALEWLQADGPKKKSDLEDWRQRIGNPDDKNTNYH